MMFYDTELNGLTELLLSMNMTHVHTSFYIYLNNDIPLSKEQNEFLFDKINHFVEYCCEDDGHKYLLYIIIDDLKGEYEDEKLINTDVCRHDRLTRMNRAWESSRYWNGVSLC